MTVNPQRVILTLDADGALQTHEFDDEYADWDLGSKISPAHPNTSIAAVYDGRMLCVYYQDEGAKLRASVSEGYMKQWKAGEKPLVDVKAVAGTGLSATMQGDKVSLFYANEDFSIHQMVYNGKDWIGEH